MRKSLEEIQLKHSAEMEAFQRKLDDAETKKEHAETQFQKLLERVNTIKAQLGERLKEDAVCWRLYRKVLDLAHELNNPIGRTGAGELEDRGARATKFMLER